MPAKKRSTDIPDITSDMVEEYIEHLTDGYTEFRVVSRLTKNRNTIKSLKRLQIAFSALSQEWKVFSEHDPNSYEILDTALALESDTDTSLVSPWSKDFQSRIDNVIAGLEAARERLPRSEKQYNFYIRDLWSDIAYDWITLAKEPLKHSELKRKLGGVHPCVRFMEQALKEVKSKLGKSKDPMEQELARQIAPSNAVEAVRYSKKIYTKEYINELGMLD